MKTLSIKAAARLATTALVGGVCLTSQALEARADSTAGTRQGTAPREEQVIASRSYRQGAMQDIIGRSVARPQRQRPDRQRSAGERLELAGLERTQRYRPLIDYYSKLNRLAPELVSAVIYAESGGDPRAESTQGAAGLMQLMPRTARSLGVEDRYDAEQNIASGTKYLRGLVERFGSTELALWAYNAGPAAVKSGHMPPETEEYVPKVMRLAKVFKGLARAR